MQMEFWLFTFNSQKNRVKNIFKIDYFQIETTLFKSQVFLTKKELLYYLSIMVTKCQWFMWNARFTDAISTAIFRKKGIKYFKLSKLIELDLPSSTSKLWSQKSIKNLQSS